MNAQLPQQQSSEPDFDFILKQKNPQTSKTNRKVIVLVALIVLTSILVIVGLLTSANQNVVQEGSESALVPVDLQSAETVVEDFLAKTEAKDYDAAYQNVTANNEDFTKEAYMREALPILGLLDLDNCVVSQENAEENELIFGCSAKDSDLRVNLEFVLTQQDGNAKILYYRLGQVA